MHITLTVSQADLSLALSELLPTTIWLDDKHERWMKLERPTQVEVGADLAIRIATSGALRWTIANVPTTLGIDGVRLRVRPSIDRDSGGGQSLAFRFTLEDAQLSGAFVSLLDGAVTKAVNAALNDRAFGWRFSDTLTRVIGLPDIFSEVAGVRLATGPATLSASAGVIHIGLALEVGFARTK